MMIRLSQALLGLSLISQGGATPASTPHQACNRIQYNFPSGTNKNDPRAEAVKKAYVREWNEYMKYAFPNDDLMPLSHNYTNDLFGWGASVVDGIDTAIVMGLTDIVEQQLQHIASVDFTKSSYLVNFFDVNIRYLGGLLSAYDLIKSGQFPNSYDKDLVEILLSQAKTLATAISPVFDTITGLPAAQKNFSTGQILPSTSTINGTKYNSTNTAQAGTLILEYYRLSDLTGDESFRQHAKKAEDYLIKPNPAPMFPGLVSTELDMETGKFITFDAGWQAGVDSFIEYLIKTYIYNPQDEYSAKLRDFWVTASESSIENIALSPYHKPELTFLSQLDANGSMMWTMDDYACFAGGNLLLGGKYLDRPDFTDLGLKVTDSCHWLYNSTITGLGPSTIAWYNSSNKAYDPAYNNNATYRAEATKYGYFIEDPSYRSYPEPLESIWYAYRITGDTRWQEYNWEIFQALDTHRSAAVPYTEISDVNAPGGGELVNLVSSFYFAEVLKYLYLSFTETGVLSLDEWVFNTESHPYLIQSKCASS
ncbi:mannosyl-oligosaccharide alpha-1-2-mannosidase 1B [Penicillium canescens]|uniref:alpha-1,2-Mannosidase n=1 Tax=Penicillium canescens TaxID=5083 RepID=A0AAD6NDF3_PENCN|nr:mannosyl-oligosaccharide alpha-1-2-mannosidase 1B [Penicillium canescens]KAJ6033872.1 mannosyl-oligosaccharide alpha-1-2-mannosidase 1B [Penicillium canescens]KAJ6056938.1 mannosyl-oligosaccharide alpha-1-2-mannosidase 1B [Penicillium canescens]KAJ6058248.1 mannosyl-oligosaccharide alpha-1-2-mannosidase 1B [Penicillium canescens]